MRQTFPVPAVLRLSVALVRAYSVEPKTAAIVGWATCENNTSAAFLVSGRHVLM